MIAQPIAAVSGALEALLPVFFLFYRRGVLRRFWTVCGSPEAARRARTLWCAPVTTPKRLGAVPGRFVAVFRVAVFPRPFSFCAEFKFNQHNDFRDK